MQTLLKTPPDAVSTRRFVRVTALFSAGTALIVLLGWSFDLPALRRLLPGQVSVAPLTAELFLAAAAALWFLQDAEGPFWMHVVGRCLAVAVGCVGALVVAEYLLGFDFPLERAFFLGPVQREGYLPFGRPSPAAAFSSMLVGLALVITDSPLGSGVLWVLLLPLFLSSFAVMGYASASSPLYRLWNLTPMAFPSALVFTALELGVIAARPGHALVRLVASRRPGGRMARRLLPAVVILLFVLQWLRLWGEKRSGLSGELGTALSAAADAIILSSIILWQARALDRQEARREAVTRRLEDQTVLMTTLIDSLPDLVFVKDRQGRFVLVNRALAATAGLGDTAALVGRTDRDVSPAELAEQYLADDRLVMETRQARANIEEPSQRKDGVGRWVLTTKVPLLDQAGAVVGVIGVSHDITERRQAELKLEEERSLLRTVIETLPDPIYLKDRQGRFTLANQAAADLIRAGCPDDLLGKTDRDFYPEEYARTYHGDESAVLGEGRKVVNKEEPRADGAVYLTTKVPVRGPRGEIIGLVGVSRDITLLKAMEVRVARAQRLESLSILAGGIAHQFNNINAAVRGYLDLLGDQGDLSPQGSQFLERASQGIERSIGITQRMLALAGLTQARDEPDCSPGEVLGGMIESLARQAEQQGAELRPDIARTPLVSLGRSQVGFVVTSLISNALDSLQGAAMRVVTVRCQLQQPMVLLEVGDTGAGVSPEDQPRLFTPFFTRKGEWAPPGSPLSAVKGVGLSLAICRSLLEGSGGRIEVKSIPGSGSTFHAWFPVAGV